MSIQLAGHALYYEGAAMTGNGNGIVPYFGSVGFAKCRCGAYSETKLPSRAARKRWHRAHKDEVRFGQRNLVRGGA